MQRVDGKLAHLQEQFHELALAANLPDVAKRLRHRTLHTTTALAATQLLPLARRFAELEQVGAEDDASLILQSSTQLPLPEDVMSIHSSSSGSSSGTRSLNPSVSHNVLQKLTAFEALLVAYRQQLIGLRTSQQRGMMNVEIRLSTAESLLQLRQPGGMHEDYADLLDDLGCYVPDELNRRTARVKSEWPAHWSTRSIAPPMEPYRATVNRDPDVSFNEAASRPRIQNDFAVNAQQQLDHALGLRGWDSAAAATAAEETKALESNAVECYHPIESGYVCVYESSFSARSSRERVYSYTT